MTIWLFYYIIDSLHFCGKFIIGGIFFMTQLRKFIKVSYESAENARNALQAAEVKFCNKSAFSRNFNRVEDTSVFFEKSGNSVFDIQVKRFLLSLSGSLPENCHVK